VNFKSIRLTHYRFQNISKLTTFYILSTSNGLIKLPLTLITNINFNQTNYKQMIKPLLLVLLSLFFTRNIIAQGYIQADIQRVLIDPETNYVHIYYTGTDHPDVTHYKISQWMITGNNPFTTGVPIESSSTAHEGLIDYHWSGYIEEALSNPVGFTVGAYNSADEPLPPSPLMPPDSSMHLTAFYDSCEASVSLHWNDYNAWRGNIQEYEVYGDNNNGGFNVLARLHEGTTDTIIRGLQANNDYLFFIIARLNRLYPDNYVSSNGVRFTTRHAYYPEFIHADYGTVGGGNNPLLHFTIDSLSELNKYKLFRSEEPSGTYAAIDSFPIDGSILEYTDSEVNAAARPYYYKLNAINYCESEIVKSENTAGTIFLAGSLTNQINGEFIVALDWSEYFQWITGVNRYTIERSLSGNDYEVISETNQTFFADNTLNNLSGQGVSDEVCYRITAYENPGGTHSSGFATSISNIYCVLLPTNIEFEFDAFVPGLDGFATFGPTIDFLPSHFVFKIFNRSGTKVFESGDPSNPRWDGTFNGDFVPEGVYRYQLEYEDESGRRATMIGKVSVARE
jgi:gliding motility-associated-like protein